MIKGGKIFVVIFSIFSMIVNINCKSEKKEKFTIMEFKVIDSLLSNNYFKDSSKNILIGFPKKFKKISYPITGDTLSFNGKKIELIELSNSENKKTTFFLFDLSNLNNEEMRNVEQKINSIFLNKNSNLRFARDSFVSKGVVFKQTILQIDSILFVGEQFYNDYKGKYQLGFVTNKNEYNNSISRIIETVLGSIRLKDKLR